jgi:NodT family efflux transporter outer membrane factor (OMF) lipoprotein
MPIRRRTRHRPSQLVWACLAVTILVGLAGCTTSIPDYIHNGFKVGPNYNPPPAPLPVGWIDQGDPRVRVGSPNLACWWEVFGDPVLMDLIHRSYASNLTLRAAGLQILAAQIQRRIAASELLPQSQSAAASYSRIEISGTGGISSGPSAFFGTSLSPPATTVPVAVPSTPIAGVVDPGNGSTSTSTGTGFGTGSIVSTGTSPSRFFDNWATSLNLSWELDFWGLYRRNLEAASAVLDQSAFNYDEMTVLMLANVATEYVEFRTLQRRLQLARRNVALQEPLVAQFEQRFKAGIANSYPGYYQLKSNLENTRALIPQLEITLRQTNNALCSLLGIPMQDLTPILGDGTMTDPANAVQRNVRIPRPVDYSVVVAIPAEFLLQRPDVKSAEEQLRIQSAEIGVAESELLPHLGINGSIGLASSQFNRLFNAQSGTGTIGPSLTWNILNYGRLLGNVRLQNTVYQQYVAEYQQAILNANQDAENALIAYLRSMEQAEHLRESAEAAFKQSEYLIRQFERGYLPPGSADTSAFINQIFTAVNFMVTQQDAAAQAEGNIALNLILLYRAMGGGWQIRLTDGRHPLHGPGVNCGPQAPPAPPVGAGGSLPPSVPATPPAAPETLPAPKAVPPAPAPAKPDAGPAKLSALFRPDY